MEHSFANKQIIWAKVKGYPWWPAKICKLPTPEANVFKVEFIAEDTHAYLNPKDVRKYEDYYDQCSKKKMRGLSPAIQTADDLHKKRLQSGSKTPNLSPQKKPRQKNARKNKGIKRPYRRRKVVSSDSHSSSSSSLSEKVQPQPSQNVISQPQVEEPSRSFDENDNEMVQSQKFEIESEEKIDRNKIDSFEDHLLKVAEKIKENTYQFSQNDFKGLQTLTGDQLLLGKITNLLNFIISKLPTGLTSEIQWLNKVRSQLKQKIMAHLYDTSYYDQYLKLIQKNKKSRSEYESKLTGYLKSQYKIKKELSILFASKLAAEVNNGVITKYKQLLEDIKEHRLDCLVVNNKAAIDRCIEAILPKYV